MKRVPKWVVIVVWVTVIGMVLTLISGIFGTAFSGSIAPVWLGG